MAGTEPAVPSWTEVEFGNQVDCRANSARCGKRAASIWPFAFIIDVVGNSSRTTRTTGVRAATFAVVVAASAGRTSFSAGEKNRKTIRNTIGAGASTVR